METITEFLNDKTKKKYKVGYLKKRAREIVTDRLHVAESDDNFPILFHYRMWLLNHDNEWENHSDDDFITVKNPEKLN